MRDFDNDFNYSTDNASTSEHSPGKRTNRSRSSNPFAPIIKLCKHKHASGVFLSIFVTTQLQPQPHSLLAYGMFALQQTNVVVANSVATKIDPNMGKAVKPAAKNQSKGKKH